MRALELVRERFGVHATYHLAQTVAGRVDLPYVRTTYPPEWIARYLLAGYVRSDPIAMAGFERVLPFDWSEIEVPETAMPMMLDALKHGLGPAGFSVPILDRNGRRGLFSINGNATVGPWQDFIRVNRESLLEIAHVVHRMAIKELFGDETAPKLTSREREVLTWAARGKDYKDIGEIIGISHHTAKAYLKSARYKLDCSNLPQAVAKALSLRLISD